MVGTRELRQSKLVNTNTKLSITVAGHNVEESQSERLLGIIINNSLTWHNHLYGNEEHKGLIPKLSQRAGLVRKLSSLMPPERLRIVANEIFFSLVSYGIQIYGSVSGLVEYSEDAGRHQALTREDSHNIQVLINVVLRSLTTLGDETPVWQLLHTSGFLSFHQMCAFSTICTTQKILLSKEPKYLYDIISGAAQDHGRPRRYGPYSSLPYKLSLSRDSFLYQAIRLQSKIPESLAALEDILEFKKKIRIWVKNFIPIYM